MKRLSVLVVTIIIVVLGLVVWWKNGTQAVSLKDNSPKIFVVEKGMGVREIANSLKSQGIIRDPIIFFLLTKQMGVDKEIQAGDFRLNPSMDMYTVIQTLRHGTLDIWTTIPEGLRSEEIAKILKDIIPSYKQEWQDVLATREGYLFPDTYLIPRDAGINLVMNLMQDNFNKKYQNATGDKLTGLSKNQIITLASIIEREAKSANDKQMVASVLLNRINIGMKLDIDATVQYALGYQTAEKTWWKKNLTFDDLKIKSPYNTYKNAGIPPGPISNPGVDSISAVINPAKTDYIYYISDKSGKLHFAKTAEEHNANIQKYGP